MLKRSHQCEGKSAVERPRQFGGRWSLQRIKPAPAYGCGLVSGLPSANRSRAKSAAVLAVGDDGTVAVSRSDFRHNDTGEALLTDR
ncbi:hypothetical protein O3Q52_29055 [Streptomyces sp. ActVer]|uniref:hypothetical protein n=1 Tax=Streptomyces sp. ActVer TaxID=3014558 RepID=UPI0022B55B16|nr:hypothetical protein [Streptomyces sp. ActVer]MCZ4512149.1 hypothetical protein [Streptomyces sp. ActVer]